MWWWVLIVFVLAAAVVALVVVALRAVGVVRSPLSHRVRIAAGAVPFVVVVGVFGAILIYTKLINDPAPALSAEDLGAVFADDTTATTVTTTSLVATTDPAGPTIATSPGTSTDAIVGDGAGALDGVWDVDPTDDGTTFGYRVQEVLGGIDTTATGRGSDITGSITIAGTDVTEGSFTVQVASITSDRSNRDNQFRGRVMQTDEFPTATFALTAPIELGSIPADGEQITTTATGELTLHGVTNEVTFDVTAQTDGSTIGVLGSIPIVFADYGIDNPSNGMATTEDNGLLEFVLVFVRAA